MITLFCYSYLLFNAHLGRWKNIFCISLASLSIHPSITGQSQYDGWPLICIQNIFNFMFVVKSHYIVYMCILQPSLVFNSLHHDKYSILNQNMKENIFISGNIPKCWIEWMASILCVWNWWNIFMPSLFRLESVHTYRKCFVTKRNRANEPICIQRCKYMTTSASIDVHVEVWNDHSHSSIDRGRHQSAFPKTTLFKRTKKTWLMSEAKFGRMIMIHGKHAL